MPPTGEATNYRVHQAFVKYVNYFSLPAARTQLWVVDIALSSHNMEPVRNTLVSPGLPGDMSVALANVACRWRDVNRFFLAISRSFGRMGRTKEGTG